MPKLTLRDLDLQGKKVLVRVDFNVPLDTRENVIDDARIRKALPTIKHILNNKGLPVLISHWGRPQGREDRFKMEKLAQPLQALLERDTATAMTKVQVLEECIGPEVQKALKDKRESRVLLLENLRFEPGEETNDPEFARELAFLGDVYVNEAFSASHRTHASIVGVPARLKTAMGYLFEKEVTALQKLLESIEKPYMVVLGGAKISDKLPLIQNLLKPATDLFIGGAMAYTFLAAQGLEIGSSKYEPDLVDPARRLFKEAAGHQTTIHLPVDHLVASRIDAHSKISIQEKIQAGLYGVDIGPHTAERFSERLRQAKTLFWNGPLGAYEIKRFQGGTQIVAQAITQSPAFKVAGGGDTQAIIDQFGLEEKFNLVSTGGGAALEFLSGKALPGYDAIHDK